MINFNGLTKITRTVGVFATKNSPTILTGLSVAGLLSTVGLAITATPKAMRIIEDLKNPGNLDSKGLDMDGDILKDGTYVWKENGKWKAKPNKKHILKATWKVYVPTAAMGLVTTACIVGANSINLRRNAALASVYSISELALKEYQAKVIEKFGADKEREVRDEIRQDRVRRNPVSGSDIIVTGTGETLFYDILCDRYAKGDVNNVRKILNQLSRQLMTDMWIPLNDVYLELGWKPTKLGNLMGWHIDNGLIEPDFSTQMSDDDRPCVVLDFVIQPQYLDRDY